MYLIFEYIWIIGYDDIFSSHKKEEEIVGTT